jgi:hypothetical protein
MAIQRHEGAHTQLSNSTGAQTLNPDALNAGPKALSGLGAAASQFGHKLELEQAKAQVAESRAGALNAASELQNDLALNIDPSNPQYRTKLDEGLRAIHQTYLDNTQNKVARAHLNDVFTAERGRMLAEGLQIERNAQIGHAAIQTRNTLNILQNTTETNPELFNTTQAQGISAILSSGVLTENQKQEAVLQFKSDVRVAQLQGLLRSNPNQVHADLIDGKFDKELIHSQKEQLIKQSQSLVKQGNNFAGMEELNRRGIPLDQEYSRNDIDAFYDDKEAQIVNGNNGAPPTPFQYAQLVNQYKTPNSRMNFQMTQAILYGKPEEAAPWLEVYKGLRDPDTGAPQALATLNSKVVDRLSLGLEHFTQSPSLGPAAAMEYANKVSQPEHKAVYDGRLREIQNNKAYLGTNFENKLAESMGMPATWWKFNSDRATQLPPNLKYRALDMFQKMVAGHGVDEQTALNAVASQLGQTFGPNPINTDGPWIELPPNRVMPGENGNGIALKNQFAFALEDLSSATSLLPEGMRLILAKPEQASNAREFGNTDSHQLGAGYKSAVTHGQRQHIKRDDERVLDTDIFGSQMPEYVIEGRARKIMFDTDDITRNAPLGQLSYYLYYYNDRGIKTPLMDPQTGTPARWYPQPTNVFAANAIKKQTPSLKEAVAGVKAGTKARNDLIGAGVDVYSPLGTYQGGE